MFHRVGPETAKHRCPYVFGTARSPCAAIVNGTIAFEAVVAVANVLDGPMSSSDQSVCSGQATAGIGLQVRTNPTLSPQPLQYI